MLLQSERREKTLSVIEPPVLHRVGTTNTGSPNDQPGQDFPTPPHIQDAHRPERGGVQAAPSGLRAGLGVRPGPPGRGAGVRWAQGEAGGHGGQAGVHSGVFPALPHPSGAGAVLRDGPAAGEWGSVSRWDPLVGSARKRLAESPKMKSFLLDFFKIYEGLSLTSSIESKGLSIQIN